jgi:hypothetical protein
VSGDLDPDLEPTINRSSNVPREIDLRAQNYFDTIFTMYGDEEYE